MYFFFLLNDLDSQVERLMKQLLVHTSQTLLERPFIYLVKSLLPTFPRIFHQCKQGISLSPHPCLPQPSENKEV